MEFKSIFLNTLLLVTVNGQLTNEQQPLHRDGPNFDLINELKKAEIIPTVLDEFKPFLKLNVTWGPKATADVGNTLKPKKLQSTPEINFLDHLPDFFYPDNQVPQLTLALTDPDARSRDNPDWSEMCHWIATDVKLTHTAAARRTDGKDDDVTSKFHEIVPYKAPGPPPKTGKHRYVFAALAPRNGTTAKLNLSRPKDRQHWGYGEVRRGLREWAEENGLEVVGANFVYAQHKKQ